MSLSTVTGGFVRQPRLLVIQHNLDDSLNDLGGALVAAGLRVDTWCTFRSDTPPLPLELFDGVLSLGGPTAWPMRHGSGGSSTSVA